VSHLFQPLPIADIIWHGYLPYSLDYGDWYCSVENAIAEKLSVFISGNQLIERWSALSHDSGAVFRIGETGFGAGLNFILAWNTWVQYAPKTAKLHFVSCDKHPFSIRDLERYATLWPELNQYYQQLIDNYPLLTPGYHEVTFLEGRVRLTLMLGDVFDCFEQLLVCGDGNLEMQLRPALFDAWFLDGFSPSKNERMWRDALFTVISLLSDSKTTAATYTVDESVISALIHSGFRVEKKKGYGLNCQSLVATYEDSRKHSIKKRTTPWHQPLPKQVSKKHALIVGAGLAGCFSAYALAKRGWRVTVIEALSNPGTGASGNTRTVLFPKLSAYRSPLTEWMLSAFLYAHRIYTHELKACVKGALDGALLLAHDDKEYQAQQRMEPWLQAYPDLGFCVDAIGASELAGIPLRQGGLFIPMSGWIDMPFLCQQLLNTKGIELITDTEVNSLLRVENQWHVGEYSAEVLILANGYNAGQFLETMHLPIKAIRGQMTMSATSCDSAGLRIPICGVGHVIPETDGVHHFGATYGSIINEDSNKDNHLNQLKRAALSPSFIWSNDVIGHWAGVRATTQDYLPLVGSAPLVDAFLNQYAPLKSDSNCWVAKHPPYHPGLYVCAGFGSRGLTSIPLSAEWLASCINNELGCLPRALIQALSPARFLRKDIIRGKGVAT
jgi:tRNA 5-methylaminomethyl-2-thiouridine biosynthesis bifunctional protein